jgi:hypothetical protein
MSKHRCTQSGCDEEHTPSVHRLMAEEHAGVNLVAEGDSEYKNEDEEEDEYEDREEDEGWWVGTIGAVEMPSQEEEIPSEADESEPEHPPSGYFSEEVAGDGRWSPGPIQPYPAGGKAGTQQPQVGWIPHIGLTTATDRSLMGRSPSSTGTKQRRLRKKSKSTVDRRWEGARRDAWLRQMLSDTSSDGDEESYGRFVESGRWMAELFEIPQHPGSDLRRGVFRIKGSGIFLRSS